MLLGVLKFNEVDKNSAVGEKHSHGFPTEESIVSYFDWWFELITIGTYLSCCLNRKVLHYLYYIIPHAIDIVGTIWLC